MKMFRMAVLLIVIAGGLVFANGGSEQENEGPVTLRVTIWSGNASHLEVLNGIAAEYKAMNPDVEVVYETIPFGDYVTKLTLQLAGSNPPDIGWLLESSAPTFLASGVLAELGDALRSSADYDFDDLSEPALSLWVDGEDVYGIPFSTSPFLFFYNEDLFREAGVQTPMEMYEAGSWTWENFQIAAKVIKESTGKYAFQTFSGAGYDTRVWHAIVPVLRAYGADVWDANGNVLLNTPEAKEAMNLYHNMIFVDETIVPPGNLSDFFTGDAAATTTQISRIPKLADAGFNWGIAPLPAGPAEQPRVIGQAAFAVFQSSRNVEAATDFLAFMTNAENTAKLAQFFPPARKSILNSDDYMGMVPALDADTFGYLIDGIENGFVLPAHENFPKIDLIARGEFDSLWVPDADVDAVLDAVAASIEPLM